MSLFFSDLLPTHLPLSLHIFFFVSLNCLPPLSSLLYSPRVFICSILSLACAFSHPTHLFSFPSRPSSFSSPSSCFLHFETSALTACCRTTRRSYPQFTSSHNEDAGCLRCRVQTLKAAIRKSSWVRIGEEVKVASDAAVLRVFSWYKGFKIFFCL